MDPYDNDRSIYLADEDWENGQWLMDTEDKLYIIPLNGDDVGGPDNEMSGRILATLRKHKIDELDTFEATNMCLQIIPSVLKRFSPETGYYSA